MCNRKGIGIANKKTGLQFSLRDLLTFVAALPICVGLASVAENLTWSATSGLIDVQWYGEIRRFLVDRGVATYVVTGYVSFVLLDLPSWFCYSLIALAIGLMGSRVSLPIAIAFVFSVFFRDLLLDSFGGSQFWLNLRVVSAIGTSLTLLGYVTGRYLNAGRGSSGRRGQERITAGNVVAVVCFTAASMYGWWIVGKERVEIKEIQEEFEDARMQWEAGNE
ncbi:MAG: hypothetical protein AAF664_23180 [Planctomycetota bacterium]